MVSLPVPLSRILDPAHRIRRPDWIEIDKDYLRDINMKRAVIEEHKERVLNSLPENDDASGELLETLIDWLPKVHPRIALVWKRRNSHLSSALSASGTPCSSNLSPVESGTRSRTNTIRTSTSYRASRRSKSCRGMCPSALPRSSPPLLKIKLRLALPRLVQDDFLMGRERADGQIYFTGGVVAHPGSHADVRPPPIRPAADVSFQAFTTLEPRSTNPSSTSMFTCPSSTRRCSSPSSGRSSGFRLTSRSSARVGRWLMTTTCTTVSKPLSSF